MSAPAPLHPRARSLIQRLGMQPHPEGGWYVETYRSEDRVTTASGATRSALTSIFFLLADGGFSRWHRVRADEAWHFYEGAELALRWLPPQGEQLSQGTLGPLADHAAGAPASPVLVVPAGCWQAAETRGDYTLVGCTVGPGFDFADFQLLRDHPEERSRVVARHPQAARWL